MISERQIREIIAQYEKHGWNLRRVLLCEPTEVRLVTVLFGKTDIVSSRINALWFSRASSEGRETWELRCLTETPFALVEVFEAEDEESVRDEAREEMETRMSEQASKLRGRKVAG